MDGTKSLWWIHESIKKNIDRSSLSDLVRLIAKAAGKEWGTVTFDAGPAAQTGWGGIANSETASSIEVPLTRLDHELPDEIIEVLKVDVEDADTWVLMGCVELLVRNRSDKSSLSKTFIAWNCWGFGPARHRNSFATSVTFVSRLMMKARKTGIWKCVIHFPTPIWTI